MSISGYRRKGPVIEVKDLHKSFNQIEVLKGIDLHANKGEVIALIGGSGSGKSTTLRCLNLLETPQSVGSMRLLGEDVLFKPSKGESLDVLDKKQLRWIRTKLAMVFQNFNLWPHMTLEQNIMEAPVHVLGQSKIQARDKAHDLLDRVGLLEKRNSYPSFLSGGQQQRAAIARALAVDPEVLLFDEPTSALDPELVGEVLSVMTGLADEGRTMIIVTHEMQFAAEVADRIIFLDQGKIEEQGTPDQIFKSPQSPRLQQFIKNIY
ncbi:ABC transporter ATP-binding protein [Vibrio algarum]|uniref:Amino acid ABC transporter ATP-binding protein n=1 Tax=Vibrio algarum TaxID=3020714 RepID=A0ABT4YPK1_9VIBR|nr:amino acid ABC transporter ATP-binding protein [Vibrio sp. KJ40-1]MDB1123488.1 amino acid ABC transporter ATP-binding protein [Vibrio sp. KJ40-1]